MAQPRPHLSFGQIADCLARSQAWLYRKVAAVGSAGLVSALKLDWGPGEGDDPRAWLEWRIMVMRWFGIAVVLAVTIITPLSPVQRAALLGIVGFAAAYNLLIAWLVKHSRPYVMYVSTTFDALATAAFVFVAGFNSKFYVTLFSIVVATSMRVGAIPSLLVVAWFTVADVGYGTVSHALNLEDVAFRSFFLALVAVLSATLHRYARSQEVSLTKANEQLRAAVTAERDLARTKDELVSVVSHELRAPLANVVGFAELLLDRDVEEAQRQEFLKVIYDEGRRLTDLINDFLDLQRMESGRTTCQLTPVDLRAVLERAAGTASEDPKYPLVVDVPSGLPIVRADSDRLLQVIDNLLSNARKYSPQGGEITLSAQLEGATVRVAVTDHGLGLPAEAIPQLFQKFYRVDNPDRYSIRGSGLGLAICREIISAHSGQIGAESAGLGKGSTFWLTLPMLDGQPSGGEVLIVEDDSTFARLLEVELANEGLSATRAGNAEAGLGYLGTSSPKAIILDLMLPGMSGETFLARLSEVNRPRPVVVVVTVKDLDPDESLQLERLGVAAIFRKGGPAVASQAANTVARLAQASIQKQAVPSV